jgi:hypothetical protein
MSSSPVVSSDSSVYPWGVPSESSQSSTEQSSSLWSSSNLNQSSSSIWSSSRTWVPGHCMRRRNLKVQDPNCPIGYTWRKGHKRRPAPVEETHKHMHKFHKRVSHVLAKNPVLCQHFEDLEEFENCLLLIKKSMQSFFLKYPSKEEVKRYADHLVDRTIMCAGTKLQNTCYLQPTTKMRRYIERTMQQYIEAYLRGE